MSDASISSVGVAVRGLQFHWRIALSLAFGVAVATAVITGALVVGDSMRSSLRALTEQRLGKVDLAVIPGGFFDPQRLLADHPDVTATRSAAIILFARSVVEFRPPADPNSPPGTVPPVRRASTVQMVASDADFWQLGTTGVRPKTLPGEQSVVLNQAAADELGVAVGDQVTIRLPREQAVPADSPLGRRDAESEGLPRMEVVAVIPNRGLGRFSLTPNQAEPLIAFLSREMVADVLSRPGQANTLLIDVSQEELNEPQRAATVAAEVQDRLRPRLEDYGLQLSRIRQTFPASAADADGGPSAEAGEVVFDYYSLTSDRLLLPNPVVDAVKRRLGRNAQPVLTYLANAIERIGDDGQPTAVVPYSTITAIDSSATLPLDYAAAEPGDRVPVVLNSWAAEQLSARPGDALRVFYFEPETTSGRELERSFDAVLTDVVPITAPSSPYRRTRPAQFDMPPTVYNDPDLTPTVPGVTDQDSISDWDLPFQLEREISDADDAYWNNYRLTPKAFIPLAEGRRHFGSRFGNTTSLRIDRAAAADIDQLRSQLIEVLDARKAQLGFAVLPLRAQQMAASQGTTPFDMLFLSLSMFVIFAALLLIALLFRLGLVQRCREYGALLSTGWTSRQVTRLAVREGLLSAVPGSLLGVLAGLGYAAAVLWALRSLWVGAVTVPFLQFDWTWRSLIIGFLAGVVIAWLTILITARRLRKVDTRTLLAGRLSDAAVTTGSRGGRNVKLAAAGCVVASILAGGAALTLSGQAQGGVFVGAGMLLLVGLLLGVYARLATVTKPDAAGRQRRPILSLTGLAAGSARRNPLRSTLTIGLMAAACFLIVAMGAFRLTPSDAGVGGFELIAQTAQPVYRDLGDAAVQRDLLGPDARLLAEATVIGLRLRPGQDASCNNLYQAVQPQVLGVPPQLADHYERGRASGEVTAADGAVDFDWAAVDGAVGEASPWRLLEPQAAGTEADPVPVILDQNTAMWSLHMQDGVGEIRGFLFDDGQQRYFRVVGLLSNSVLQGSLLIGQANFKRLFPEISGDQFFLVDTGVASPAEVAGVLENRLGDVGMDAVDSRSVLARLLAVQNTYLRTFQSLGALGLLLGTIGLAVAQLRSVLERRGELAVMRAVGFTRGRLAAAVMLENAALLIGGIGCGVVAAVVAVIPYAVVGRAQLPILEPLIWMALVLAVGLLASLLVLRRVVRMPLLQSLRGQ